MPIKAVLFDKDGTIADFRATFDPATRLVLEELSEGDGAVFEKACAAVGFDHIRNRISPDSIIVAGSGLEIATCLATVVGRKDHEQFRIELDKRFGEVCRQTVAALPGVSDAIRTMHGHGYILGVATNDSEDNARIQMQALGIEQCFEKILGADSGHGAKPSPGMIEAFIEHAGFDPTDVMMVGDSTHDLHAGAAAGVRTCAVLTGPAQQDELAPHADHVLASVAELHSVLLQA